MSKKYVHFGCGLSAPTEWENYDVSPTLRLQKIPVVGRLIRKRLNVVFPENVKVGDIIKGLPVRPNTCDGIYCSHTLEHLSLTDCRIALNNTFTMLKPGGIFRCVVPDLEAYVKHYLHQLSEGKFDASIKFLDLALLGTHSRPRGVRGFIRNFYSNSNHLWMWDHHSLSNELASAGFQEIRRCKYHDSEDPMFRKVEDIGRFKDAVALECKKPNK